MIKQLFKTNPFLGKCHKALFEFSVQQKEIANILQKYYKKNQLLQGYASEQATHKYKQRFISKNIAHPNSYTKIQKKHKNNQTKDSSVFVSSLGIGTQNGEPKAQDDYKMAQILIQSMTNGINYVDTDINFRYGKSEKVINACLNYLTKQKGFSRDQFFISTKFGYVPTDVDSDLSSQKLVRILKDERYLTEENIVQQIYGWGEGFIDFSIEKSRLSLGLQTIDNVFLNNFSQAQMSLVEPQQFRRRLEITFTKLQEVRSSGRIRNYGLCSFVGLRSPPNEQGVHVNLQKMSNLVKDCAGTNNGFKYIMLPLNLGMPEALLKWQKYKNAEKQQTMRIFEVAERQNLKIILCSPLFQGRVANLPFSSSKLSGLGSNAAKHLQFIRSINSNSLVSTVFGTKNIEHLRGNLQVMKHDKISHEDWKQILPIPE